MIDAIDANGWLQGHDAALTGYMPSAAHVTLARDLVVRLRRRGPVPTVVVDPVLGDDPGGLYVDETAAVAIRDELVPLADILTPNRFELGWLASRSVATLADVSAAASEMAKGPNRAVIVTSPPVRGGDTGAMAIGRDGETALFRTARLDNVPHGVGDAFSAMIAAGLDVGAALGHLQALVEASAGAEHLNIVGSVDRWRTAPAIEPNTLPFPGED
jgi:pyridoxine kinase